MSMPSFCIESFPTAKKQHRCCECRGFIQPADIYQKIAGCWDGRFETFKTCPHCLQAREFYTEDLQSRKFRDPDDGEYSFGSLFADLIEAASDIDSGTGKKFRAYRYIIEAERRGNAAKAVAV